MPLLATLKTETTESHAGLEASMDVFRKVKSVEDYRSLLSRFFTLYEPLEARLAGAMQWESAGWNFMERRKTLWLRQDLETLGVSAAEWESWARCDQLPELNDAGAALGSLYVLEGSTLGGQMISRRFQQTLGIAPTTGGAFFHGYGEETGRNWRAFGQWAETQNVEAKGALTQPAVRAARETFDTFAQWLTR
jgi:heme oxygenase